MRFLKLTVLATGKLAAIGNADILRMWEQTEGGTRLELSIIEEGYRPIVIVKESIAEIEAMLTVVPTNPVERFFDANTNQHIVSMPSIGLSGYGSTKAEANEMLKVQLDSIIGV